MDIAGLIPSFGNFALTVIAFLVALTIIVFVHEMGHYLVGRWSGIKADVFSIGIGPRLASRVDKRGTRWQIAAFPVGGYVRFHGDADAASGTADDTVMAAMSDPERRATLHGAPLWARAATVAGGPFSNFVLSAVIFTLMALWTGVASDPLTVASVKPVAGVEGVLLPGDKILAVEGQPVPAVASDEMQAFLDALPDTSPLDWTIERDGQVTHISTLNPYPPLVGGITPQSAAADAGLQKGDLILAVDGKPVATFEELRNIVGASDGAPLALDIDRGGTATEVTLTPRRVDLPTQDGGFETRWLIGVSGGLVFEPATEAPGIGTALSGGVKQVGYLIRTSVSGLAYMVSGAISTCNLRGPIGIAETSGAAASQGVQSFIWFIAVLSTAVGFLNLFPIPVLDGGHLMFHAYEAVLRRPPSPRMLSTLTMGGLVVVLALMVFGLTNDLMCP